MVSIRLGLGFLLMYLMGFLIIIIWSICIGMDCNRKLQSSHNPSQYNWMVVFDVLFVEDSISPTRPRTVSFYTRWIIYCSQQEYRKISMES